MKGLDWTNKENSAAFDAKKEKKVEELASSFLRKGGAQYEK